MRELQDIITNFEQSITHLTAHDHALITEHQRSEEWHEQRRGKFTGSRFGDLMSCKSRAKGKSWDNLEWLKDFGDTALTYVIERAIERATGQRIETPSTWQMRWGTELEPENIAALSEALGHEITECEFMYITPTSGASPDGICEFFDAIVEVKSPATVMSHYNLTNEPVVEGHNYFWQVQGEMMAAKKKKAIFNTYDKRYPAEAQTNFQFVDLSPIHEVALLFRIYVGEELVKMIIERNFRIPRAELRGCIEEICADCPSEYEGIVEWCKVKTKANIVSDIPPAIPVQESRSVPKGYLERLLEVADLEIKRETEKLIGLVGEDVANEIIDKLK